MKADRDNDANEPQAPPRLVDALRRLSSEPDPVFVPRSIDDAILSAARKQLDRPEPSRRFLPSLLWPALAAILILIVWIGNSLLSGDTRYARNDLNRDGRVDIADAFQLARHIRDGTVSGDLDLNGDGVVDSRDAEVIAVEAVSLEKRSRS